MLRLRGSICEKASKLVCCARPTTTTTTTTTTPATTRRTSVENFNCPAHRCIPIKDCENIADDYKNVKSSNTAVKVTSYFYFLITLLSSLLPYCHQFLRQNRSNANMAISRRRQWGKSKVWFVTRELAQFAVLCMLKVSTIIPIIIPNIIIITIISIIPIITVI